MAAIKVLLHLTPRSPRHFYPQYVALLSPGDGNMHSKKAAAVRSRELLEGVASTLLEFASAHVLEWSQSTSQALLLLEMATSLPGRCDWVGVVRALLLLEMATLLPGRCGRVGHRCYWRWLPCYLVG